MTLLHEAVEAKKLDTRMIERNLTRNVITADEAAKALKALPDDADGGEWVSVEDLANEASSSS